MTITIAITGAMRGSVRLLLSLALTAGAASAAGAAGPTARLPAIAGTDFWNVYGAPPAGAQAGDILHAQKRTDAPRGATGWNVVYVSEIAPGRQAYVSGEIYLPAGGGGAGVGAAKRDIVLWNHETAGLADACAPSRRSTKEGGHERVPALAALLARGYVVVASDYPGLGLPGPAFYMAGQPNARASLDMLRVARNFPGAQASNRYVMYGWSQGGQTTMWAESIAGAYAPGFTGLGAALVAPAVRIRDLTLNSMTSAENAGYVISTLPGIQAAFPDLQYRDFLTPEAMEQLPVLANGCFDVWGAAAGVQDAYQPDALVPGSPWWDAMTAVDDFRPQGTMPFAIFQGSADTTTPPGLTLRERTALCSAGNAVDYHAFEGLDHSAVVPEAASRLPDWFADRFAGKPAPNGCAAP
ncbi:lipase family protein [Pseudoduganella lutea]|uniref:Lipase n=1 Tax=Pseudoduganella lutea TaxID=321985 RepID=A0A4P6L0E6_9BURK|nr:lipase family protein [Pseudoduganella lutea]QBE64362.1 lipase [Pseudoduganella lutea]